MQHALGTDVNLKALAAAGAACLTVQSVLRALLRPRPTGPNLYWTRPEDGTSSRLQHFLFGDAVNFGRGQAGDVHLAFAEKARKSVPDPSRSHYAFFYAWWTRLSVTHPDDVDFILQHPQVRVSKPESVHFLDNLLGARGLVIITDEDYHTQQFRAVAPAFSPLSVKNIADTTMREHFGKLLNDLRNAIATSASTVATEDVHKHMTQVTLGIISEAAFRSSQIAELQPLLQAAFKMAPSLLMMLGWRAYNALPIDRNRSAARARRAIGDVVRATSERVRTTPAAEKDKKLIDFMAENPALTPEEILDHACTFAFAGHETTSTALTWLLYFVAKNPVVQSKLLEELSEAFPAGGATPSMDALRGLEYLNAVASETLRMIPPIVSLVRKCGADVVLPGSKTFVPKGTTMLFPLYVIHRNPHVWGDDAGTFRPERWIEDPDLRSRVTPCAFMPFAAGKRACIGKDFAMQEMLLGAAMLVRNFKFEWPEGQAEPIRIPSVVSRPKHPLPLRISMRT